jgi:copper(I)-binding protein
MHKFLLIALALLITACSGPDYHQFSIDDGWVREAPPNASAMAGYVTINNNTEQSRILTCASSKQFNAVEIHRTIVENGVAKMRRQDNLSIPANGSLVLEPGSFHLMLMSPKMPFKEGDLITISLCLKTSDDPEALKEDLDITIPVKKSK